MIVTHPSMKGLLIISAALLLSSVLHAQEQRNIVIRALCFSHVDNLKKIQYLNPAGGGELVEVPLWRNEPSDDIRLTVKGKKVRFVIPAEGKDGKPGFKMVAEGTLASSRRQLFYFLPGKPGGTPYILRCFNDDTEKFPMGSSRIVNLTKTAAVITMGEHKKAIKPNASVVIPAPRKVNSYNDYNRVIELATKDGHLYQVANNRGKASKAKRDFVVIYMNPRTKRPDVNFHRDIPPWTLGTDGG